MNKVCAAAVLAALLGSPQVFALPFTGTEITIYDNDGYKGAGVAGEDNETEPGMVNSQVWDLEGFWQQDNGNLAIVGGYDLINGEGRFMPGDIFVDVDGDNISVVNGGASGGSTGNAPVQTTFGYDYVFDVDWAAGSYNLIKLTDESYTQEAWYTQNYSSSPWRYVAGDDAHVASGTFDYQTGLTDSESGYLGGSHNVAYNFDLSYFSDNGYDELWFHNTMGCGNDNLLGHVATVPEPSSIAMLAIGLIGLGFLRKKV